MLCKLQTANAIEIVISHSERNCLKFYIIPFKQIDCFALVAFLCVINNNVNELEFHKNNNNFAWIPSYRCNVQLNHNQDFKKSLTFHLIVEVTYKHEQTFCGRNYQACASTQTTLFYGNNIKPTNKLMSFVNCCLLIRWFVFFFFQLNFFYRHYCAKTNANTLYGKRQIFELKSSASKRNSAYWHL